MTANFHRFHDSWTDQLQRLTAELAKNSAHPKSPDDHHQARRLADKVVTHYEDYYSAKAAAAHVRFESRVIEILRGQRTGDLDELTPDQLGRVSELQCQTVKEENEIGDELEAWQDAVARAEPGWAGLCGSGTNSLDNLLDRLVRVVTKADELRIQTLRRLVELLTPQQAMEFLIAAAELQFDAHRGAGFGQGERKEEVIGPRGRESNDRNRFGGKNFIGEGHSKVAKNMSEQEKIEKLECLTGDTSRRVGLGKNCMNKDIVQQPRIAFEYGVGEMDKNLSLAELEGNQASGNTSKWEGGGEGGGVRVGTGVAAVEKEAAGDGVCVGDAGRAKEGAGVEWRWSEARWLSTWRNFAEQQVGNCDECGLMEKRIFLGGMWWESRWSFEHLAGMGSGCHGGELRMAREGWERALSRGRRRGELQERRIESGRSRSHGILSQAEQGKSTQDNGKQVGKKSGQIFCGRRMEYCVVPVYGKCQISWNCGRKLDRQQSRLVADQKRAQATGLWKPEGGRSEFGKQREPAKMESRGSRVDGAKEEEEREIVAKCWCHFVFTGGKRDFAKIIKKRFEIVKINPVDF
ncbi:hypothetical protein Cgig2_025793 [Carnegiea gigantea]|uniref:DOG1 domain-containing protein n=1 Tax=Carnegiea gigantea TaxID=171969 RepID=A0A9Q1JH25_9CARY|nr:hypothetical protein Cgig2_025793 [Carnegiea gigantea]